MNTTHVNEFRDAIAQYSDDFPKMLLFLIKNCIVGS